MNSECTSLGIERSQIGIEGRQSKCKFRLYIEMSGERPRNAKALTPVPLPIEW